MNLARGLDAVERAAAAGADLLVLPECALTGYQFYDAATRRSRRRSPLDDPPASGARRCGGATAGDGRRRVPRTCRRHALQHRGRARCRRPRHADPQDAPPRPRRRPVRRPPATAIGPVIDTPFGTARASRSATTSGSPRSAGRSRSAGPRSIAVPVNWSSAVRVLAEHFVPVRAVENRVFVAVADRVGGAPVTVVPGCEPRRRPRRRRRSPHRSTHRASTRSATADRRPRRRAHQGHGVRTGRVRDRRVRRIAPSPTSTDRSTPTRSSEPRCVTPPTPSRSSATSRSPCPTVRCCSPTSGTRRASTSAPTILERTPYGRSTLGRGTRVARSWPSAATASSSRPCAAPTAPRDPDASSPSATTVAPRPTGSRRSRGSTGTSAPTGRATWASPSGPSPRPRRRTSTPWSSRCRRRSSSWYLGGALALELMINWDLSALNFLHPERGAASRRTSRRRAIERQQRMLAGAFDHLPVGDALLHVAGENHPLFEQQIAHPSADDPHWAPVRFETHLARLDACRRCSSTAGSTRRCPAVCDDYARCVPAGTRRDAHRRWWASRRRR